MINGLRRIVSGRQWVGRGLAFRGRDAVGLGRTSASRLLRRIGRFGCTLRGWGRCLGACIFQQLRGDQRIVCGRRERRGRGLGRRIFDNPGRSLR